MFLGHCAQMAIRALVFLFCGEFEDLATSFYFSAVNFTSLGYGGMLLGPEWRILGPIETADGVLMFGLSAAVGFAVLTKLMGGREAELRRHKPSPVKESD